MADSSKSTELETPAPSAKSAPTKGEKKKRKRGKKFGRAKFNENLDTKSQEPSTSAFNGDEQNVKGTEEDSKASLGEEKQTLAKEGTKPKIVVEVIAQDADKMATKGQEQEAPNKEEIAKEDSPQGGKSIQESSEEKAEVKADFATEHDESESSKKTKRSSFAFLRSKKSKSKPPTGDGEGKPEEDRADKSEISEVETKKAAAKEDETNEQRGEMKDEAKTEPDASSTDIQNNDASKSPEGIQEKPPSKLKQLASFGRSKKKPDVTFKNQDNELPDSETHDEAGVMTESSDLKESQDNENAASNELTPSIEKSGSTNESLDAGKEKDETKDAETDVKRKRSFLGLKRSKRERKNRKSSKNEDLELSAEMKQGEISVNVSGVEGALLEEKRDEIKEADGKEDDSNVAKTAGLQAEELPGSEETKDDSYKEQVGSLEMKSKMDESTDEEVSSTPTKKDTKSRILRSFRKLKSPRQGKQKAKENEDAVDADADGAKITEGVDTSESSEPKHSTEEQNAAEKANEEQSPKAMKRKISDLKNLGRIRAKKRQKGDNELSKQKNNAEEQTESKESKVQEEDSRELVARGDKVRRTSEADGETEDESYDSDLTMVSDITVVSSIYEVRREDGRGIHEGEPLQTGDTTKPSIGDKEKPIVLAEQQEPSQTETLQAIEESSETELETEHTDVDGEIIVIEKEDDEKKKGKAEGKGSDPFAKNPNVWILVQHLEMNEEITRQLGDMLMVNALKRTMTCCTII